MEFVFSASATHTESTSPVYDSSIFILITVSLDSIVCTWAEL